jgi:glycosyltransferase involved in cell wall biosynthesis
MKVLLLNQVFYPDSVATAQHTLDIAQHLIHRGCEVSVIAGNRAYEERQQTYPRKENYQGIKIYRVGSTGFGKRSVFSRLVDALTFQLSLCWRLLFTSRQDVVITFTSPPLIGFIGMVFCLLKGGKQVQWLMDLNPDTAIAVGYLRKNSWMAQMLTSLFGKTLHHSEKLVVLDKWMKDHIAGYGVNAEKIMVIPPWPVQKIEPLLFEQKRHSRIQTELGLQGKFIVLFSGNHSVVHPMDTLLESARLLSHDPTIHFVFVGSGLRVAEVRDFKTRFGLTNITQLPRQPREKLSEILSMADLHVVIQGSQVSGLVHVSKIYGVLVSGGECVTISPDKSHLRDIQKEGAVCWNLEHGESEKLISIIQKIKSMPEEEKRTRALQNWEFVVSHYSKENLLEKFSDNIVSSVPIWIHVKNDPILRRPV